MSNLKRYTLYIMNIVDILSLIIAFGLSIPVRMAIHAYYPLADVHQKLFLVVVVAYVITNVTSLYNDDTFLRRGTIQEFAASFKMVTYVGVISILYMYFFKVSRYFSRMFVGIFLALFVIVDFLARTFVKRLLLTKYKDSRLSEKLLIVGSPKRVSRVLKKFRKSVDWRFSIAGVVLEGECTKGEKYDDVEILSDMEHLLVELPHMSVDSVMLSVGNVEDEVVAETIRTIEALGKTVYVYINEYDALQSFRKLDQVGDCAVVSYHTTMPMPIRLELFKRFLDVVVSILLLPVYGIFYLLALIFNAIDSHGPTLIHKVRVGKNGRRFYELRFRTYRIDADERMARGETGMTVFGTLLKKVQMDALPKILNVISGEMSFVGPRALSVPELLSADVDTRNATILRPGIVGYWSMEKDSPGRNEADYISQWNVFKDLMIIFVVFLRFITFHSNRVITRTQIEEELNEIREYRAERNPLVYNHTLYQPQRSAGHYVYLAIKRLFDICASACGIILLSPFLLILTILVIADDGGSPFYGHKRIGQNGKRIMIYKFRSMRVDAGDLEKLLTPEQLEQYRNEFKIDNDPRITKIGNFIRKTSLDELPQLFNILFGSLSVIGPRPIVEEETKIYGDEIGKLLSVKPGLTGYWQAYARNNATYESGERQKMEMYYVDHQSLWLDVKIFFKTFASVLKKEGAQ